MVLDAVARHGSLAAAGRALRWSQPTVAHHLAALERELGGPTVIRSAQGATLTPLGELALGHCTEILSQVERLKNEATTALGSQEQQLRLGVIPTVGAQLLPQVLHDLDQHYTVTVIEAENDALNDEVLRGAIDIAIVTSGPLLHEHGRKVRIGTDQLLLGVAKHSTLAKRQEVSIAELPGESWILAKTHDDAADRALLYAAKAAGFEPRVSKRSDNYATVLGYVRAGFGVALVPSLAAGLNSHGVTTVAIRPRIDRTLWAVARPGLSTAVEERVATLFRTALSSWNDSHERS